MIIDGEIVDRVEIKNPDGVLIAIITDEEYTAYDGYYVDLTLGEV